MEYKEILNRRLSNYCFIVRPKVELKDRSGNVVYWKDKLTAVWIDLMTDDPKVQIYRAPGFWIRGNSHKTYPNIDRLMNDFDILSEDEGNNQWSSLDKGIKTTF